MADTPTFPEGTYRAQPDPDSVRTAGADGGSGEQISVVLRVVDEHFPHVNGKSIRWFGNFTNQQGMDISLAALRLMGWDGELPIVDEHNHVPGLGNNAVEIVVKHETYAGKTRAKIAFVNAPGGTDPFAKKRPLDAKGRVDLNERIRRHMGAGNAPRQAPPVTRPPEGARAIAQGNAPPAGQRPTYAAQPPPEPPNDEDIPF